MTTIDQEDLEVFTSGGADIKTLSGRVPSLVIESSFGKAFPRFYIRGLGNTDFDLNASQPVSMVYDEVVLENPILKGMPLFDVERVEVLRGPQGTLFGRNTPGRRRQVRLRRSLRRRSASPTCALPTAPTTPSTSRRRSAGKLTDTISARLSGVIQTRSDWIDNEFTGEDDALGSDETGALRLQFLFEPTENFNALLNLHAWEVDGTARVFRANIIKPGTNDLVSDFDQDEVFHDGQNFQDIDSQGANLRFDYDLGGSVLTSITSFETLDMLSGADIDGGFGGRLRAASLRPRLHPVRSETADGIPDLDQFTQEIRIASEGEQQVRLAGGRLLLRRGPRGRDASASTAIAPGNPLERLRHPGAADRVLRALRLDQLPAERSLGPGGRDSLLDRREGLRRRAPDPVVPAADRRADHRAHRRGQRELGRVGQVPGDGPDQRLRPRRHRLPRAVDPGPHPVRSRLRESATTRRPMASRSPTRRRSSPSRSAPRPSS